MTASTPPILVQAAEALLAQLHVFVEGLEDETYVAPASCAGDATIGQHTRHTLDHYRALFRGHTESGLVAYDKRERGTAVESDRSEAVTRIGALRKVVGAVDAPALSSGVRIEVLPLPGCPEIPLDSTLGRELAFVTHHAVHHLAIIKMIANEFDLVCPTTFGRAPSTIAHDSAG